MSSSTETGPLPVVNGHRETVIGDRAARVAKGGSRWESRYTRAVIAVDLVLITIVAVIGGLFGPDITIGIPHAQWVLVTVAAALTAGCLPACRAWEPRVLGQGAEEFGRVFRAAATSAIVLGLVGLAAGVEDVRLWTFVITPGTGLLLIGARYGLRRGLHRRRRHQGTCMHQVLAVGTPQSVAELVVRTRDARHFGWVVAGACTTNGRGFGDEDTIAGVPVVGDLEILPRLVDDGRYRIVAVTPSPDWSPQRLHRLAWDLEDSGAELVVDPGIMEVAGPRLHIKPVDGLPLLRLTKPTFGGLSQIVKGGFDRLSALLLLLVLLPVFVAIGVAVKLDGGPVFFRQTRVGRGGSAFRMIKFRSMVVDAEQRRLDLLDANEGAGPLFKMRHDPRVTRVGRLLRRYSLDELPQLFNVLGGSMSLVGPRPPLPEEVLTYSREQHRRLHVRPGLTGLWQVSGRSNLSWEESIRLDLRYVENWSLALDALILWKTLGAVMKGEGAY
ncbi:sugar transferase [Pseudonocardia bannensis]|uniref:sugar transferase n=1 Tax=Pseudonocardia bannensis TaxID=630973 RepID=UPI001B7CF72B|nr:sugar transferase [Pseudonocardia bannensis]